MSSNEKIAISIEKAPKAIGPYSQAIEVGGFIFLSGQLGLVPETGEFIDANVEAQTRQSLTNLKSIIESRSLTMKDVVKTTIFLKNMADFPKMNAVYGEFFEIEPPARSTVEVAALPKNGLVEIEAIVKM